ncbi:hypothetical protein AG1IA_10147 [Rhizoctonia solani AG-1 IA]|uniref:Uncharacterized protein n=1 Tax=Thanatephorus cucumeris (strain AG1-IA) TaxID=983506 RepID=L8WGD4_THACA|nr:hypothetical protein AG1IA_10147 [Rhizoctonia solani AG-1 IA]
MVWSRNVVLVEPESCMESLIVPMICFGVKREKETIEIKTHLEFHAAYSVEVLFAKPYCAPYLGPSGIFGALSDGSCSRLSAKGDGEQLEDHGRVSAQLLLDEGCMLGLARRVGVYVGPLRNAHSIRPYPGTNELSLLAIAPPHEEGREKRDLAEHSNL